MSTTLSDTTDLASYSDEDLPFDMVVLNRVSRYHLAIQALRHSLRAGRGKLTGGRHERRR
ncbi:MAG: hypothetical protein M3Y06_08150 [Actinomycetota bacterium]|nr:hypothetical protein [Actinomycetota bacterium]